MNHTKYSALASLKPTSKWNWVDSDLWLHPQSKKYTDKEISDSLDNFPDSEVPIWGKFKPRVTHPLP